MRTWAIGDIHGCATALKTLDQHLKFGASDRLITLGDYVDRGPNSKGVIDHLMTLAGRTNLVALRGNHDLMMLASRHNAKTLAAWIDCGGDATFYSYGGRSLTDIPEAHWDFLSQLLPYYELEQDFFVHANAIAHLPLKEQPDDMLYWEHLYRKPRPHQSGRRMVCGHTSQKEGVPLNYGHAVCIDTYAYGGGWLTCLDVDSGWYLQANEDNMIREGTLENLTVVP